MKRKWRRWGLFILVLLVLILWVTQLGQEPSAELVVEKPIPKVNKPQKRSANAKLRLAKPYSFASIEKRVQASRFQLAGCFVQNEGKSYPDVKLTVRWHRTGRFESVKVHPVVGKQTKICLTELFAPWKVTPHVREISYQQHLVLR